MVNENPDLLSATEAAGLLRISRKTVSKWARAGSLPGYRIGGRTWRFYRADVLAKLEPAVVQ